MRRDTGIALALLGFGGALLYWDYQRKKQPVLRINIGQAKLKPRVLSADIDFLANSIYR